MNRRMYYSTVMLSQPKNKHSTPINFEKTFNDLVDENTSGFAISNEVDVNHGCDDGADDEKVGESLGFCRFLMRWTAALSQG